MFSEEAVISKKNSLNQKEVSSRDHSQIAAELAEERKTTRNENENMMVGLLAFSTAFSCQPVLATYRAAGIRMQGDAEIPFDVHFLRAAKGALRKCLQAEGGMLNEDALATVGALAAVRKCAFQIRDKT